MSNVETRPLYFPFILLSGKAEEVKIDKEVDWQNAYNNNSRGIKLGKNDNFLRDIKQIRGGVKTREKFVLRQFTKTVGLTQLFKKI